MHVQSSILYVSSFAGILYHVFQSAKRLAQPINLRFLKMMMNKDTR